MWPLWMLENCSFESGKHPLDRKTASQPSQAWAAMAEKSPHTQVASQAAKCHKGAGQSRVEGERNVGELSLNIPGNSRSTGVGMLQGAV